MKNKNDMWWRYPLATLAFITICFLAPMLVSVVMFLMEYITPKYYKSGEMWIWLVSYVAGAYMGYTVAFVISKGKDGFATTLSILYAVYAIVVGTMNGMTWEYFPDATISYILSGVLVIGFHIYRLMSANKEAKNGHNT